MLQSYLASKPTITERLAMGSPGGTSGGNGTKSTERQTEIVAAKGRHAKDKN